MNFQELSVTDFKNTLSHEKTATLIDVREAYEFEEENIGGINIPMGEILGRVKELIDFDPIMLCCKSGKRSKTVAYHLSNKLSNKTVISLEGGIEAYNG